MVQNEINLFFPWSQYINNINLFSYSDLKALILKIFEKTSDKYSNSNKYTNLLYKKQVHTIY